MFYDSRVLNDTSTSNISQKMVNVHHNSDGANNESTSYKQCVTQLFHK
jgi:hypothetical protein